MCVCVCVCLLVSALPAKPFDVRVQNLAQAVTLTISRTSLKFKVIGQRSRSLLWKTWLSEFQMSLHAVTRADPYCHDMMSHRDMLSRRDIASRLDMTSRRDMTSHRDMTLQWHRLVQLAVAMCRMSVLESLWGKNTDKNTSREGASTLRRFHCRI